MSSDNVEMEITLNGRKYGRLTTGDWAGPFPYMTAELEHALDEIERLQRWKEETIGLLKQWNQIADDVIAQLDTDDALGHRRPDIVASELKRQYDVIARLRLEVEHWKRERDFRADLAYLMKCEKDDLMRLISSLSVTIQNEDHKAARILLKTWEDCHG